MSFIILKKAENSIHIIQIEECRQYNPKRYPGRGHTKKKNV